MELLVADLAALAPSQADRERMTALRDELEHVDKGRQDVLALVSEGLSSLASARPSLESLAGREEAAQRELADISARFAPASLLQRSCSMLGLADEELDARSDDLTARFYEFDLNQRRATISTLLSKLLTGMGEQV